MNKNLLVLSVVYLFFAVPLSFMDARKFRISILALCFGAVSVLGVRFGLVPGPWLPLLKNLSLAAASAFLVYFCTRVLTAGALDYADLLFGIYSALYTGFYMNIIAAFFAALTGVLYYLSLAVLDKLKKKQIVHRPIFTIPFVPFITTGSVLSMLLFWVIA